MYNRIQVSVLQGAHTPRQDRPHSLSRFLMQHEPADTVDVRVSQVEQLLSYSHSAGKSYV